mgnify:CR=1 FL=1
MPEINAGTNLTFAFGIIMNNIVSVIQLRKYGMDLIRKLNMGLKKFRIGALIIKSASSVLIKTVMLL